MPPGNEQQPLTAPVLTHARMEWNAGYPDGFIHLQKKNGNGEEIKSVGYVRGNNLARGFAVEVQRNNKKKYWTGAITLGPDEGEFGPYWTFSVVNVNDSADPDQDDTLYVTVTNTSQQTSNSQQADPQPTDIP